MQIRAFVAGKEVETEDPELAVPGYCVLRLSQIKAKAKEYADALVEAIKTDNWSSASYHAYSNGVLKALIETILKYEKEHNATIERDDMRLKVKAASEGGPTDIKMARIIADWLGLAGAKLDRELSHHEYTGLVRARYKGLVISLKVRNRQHGNEAHWGYNDTVTVQSYDGPEVVELLGDKVKWHHNTPQNCVGQVDALKIPEYKAMLDWIDKKSQEEQEKANQFAAPLAELAAKAKVFLEQYGDENVRIEKPSRRDYDKTTYLSIKGSEDHIDLRSHDEKGISGGAAILVSLQTNLQEVSDALSNALGVKVNRAFESRQNRLSKRLHLDFS